MKIVLPIKCQQAATVNYSILTQFKPANIYRFFCLSLCRDEKYHVRITLDDLKAMTGEKSLSKFNSDFREYLEIKMYSLDKAMPIKPKGTSNHVPQWKRSASQYPKTFSCMNWIRQSKAFSFS